MPSPCVLEVSLGAINDNLRMAADLAGGRFVLAAVKADAYGHGLVEVARSIEAAGTAQWLGVAVVGEARRLREAGVSLPILKFTPTFPDELPVAVKLGMTHTVSTVREAEELAAAAQRAGRVAEAHLKVDTGMRRIGAEPEEAVAVARRIAEDPNLRLTGLFTHLPVSDVVSGAGFTEGQVATMERLHDEVCAAVGDVPWFHVANSGAILTGHMGRTNLVRPGIMVYGSYPDADTPRSCELKPVVRWTTRVSFVKPVSAGESVGYGRSWTAERDTWVATIAVGYGDGYPRRLSNVGRVLINGRSYPIAGRVCMDQAMIDLGPGEPTVSVGDEVVLAGRSGDEEITVTEIADLVGTIAYEVTCQITQRVRRVHVN